LPASPPLQSLSIEPGAAGPVALLVGMAGDAHWSLSVATEAGAAALVFDAACRAKSPPDYLGSRYRTMVEPHGANGTLLLPVLDSHLKVSLLPSDATPAHVQLTGDGFGIVVDSGEANSLPRTFRWKYRVALADE
jgi:anti-sigma factor RsiW